MGTVFKFLFAAACTNMSLHKVGWFIPRMNACKINRKCSVTGI
jgi:hypothetical protein